MFKHRTRNSRFQLVNTKLSSLLRLWEVGKSDSSEIQRQMFPILVVRVEYKLAQLIFQGVSKISNPSLNLQCILPITLTLSVENLGFIFDYNICFSQQIIFSIKCLSIPHRDIRSIRQTLDLNPPTQPQTHLINKNHIIVMSRFDHWSVWFWLAHLAGASCRSHLPHTGTANCQYRFWTGLEWHQVENGPAFVRLAWSTLTGIDMARRFAGTNVRPAVDVGSYLSYCPRRSLERALQWLTLLMYESSMKTTADDVL